MPPRRYRPVETRIVEVTTERTELENAPEVFAEKRSALISEIEHAESDRRMAADALATAEAAMAETDRVARATLDALSASREACARSEERMEGARRRLDDIEREIRDMLEVEPHGVAALAEISRERSCRRSPTSRPTWKSCAATASAWARSTCAPRRNCAKSRPSIRA
jgi:chromosome segregation ATPase